MPVDLFKQAGIAPDDSGKPAPRDLFAEAGINPNLIERSGGTFKWGNRQVPAYYASNYPDRGRTFKGAMGVLAGFSDPIPDLVQRGAAVGYAQPTTTNKNPYVNALIGGAGGAALSGIEGGVNALARSRLPERLYGSAVKLPLARKWTKLLPGEEITAREAAIQEGLRSEVPPSEYGLAKARQIRQRTGKAYREKLAEREAAEAEE